MTVVDANIARTADVPELWRWAPFSWNGFQWVVWVRLADGRFGWTLLTGQLLEHSALGERWAFEIAYDDAVIAAERQGNS